MARRADKQKAIELRLAGHSYSQIGEKLNVGKGTLSVWLKDYSLSSDKLKNLRDWNQVRIERFKGTMRKKRDARLSSIRDTQKSKIFPLSQRDIFIGGLFLYWGEGGKTSLGQIALSNTDPAALRFFIKWVIDCFDFPRPKIKASLHLYKDMNISNVIDFWSKALKLPKANIHPYIKKTLQSNISYRSGFSHGTCNVRIYSAKIARQVMMGLRALQDSFDS